MDEIKGVDMDGDCAPLNSNNLYACIQSQEDVTVFIRVIEDLVKSKDAFKFVKNEVLQLLWVVVAYVRFVCLPEDFSIVSMQKILNVACTPSCARELKTVFDFMVDALSDPSEVFIKERYDYFKYKVFGTYSGFYGSIVKECQDVLDSVSGSEIINAYNNRNSVNVLACKEDEALFGKLRNETGSQSGFSIYVNSIAAIHEAGHAVVSYLLGVDIHGATIVSADNCGGAVLVDWEQIEDFGKKAIILYAGAAAHEVVLSSKLCSIWGCSNDFKCATSFVKEEIISKIKAAPSLQEYAFIDRDVLGLKESESPYITYEAIKRCSELRESALELIRDNQYLVEALASVLLVKESMAGEEIKAFLDQCRKIEETMG